MVASTNCYIQWRSLLKHRKTDLRYNTCGKDIKQENPHVAPAWVAQDLGAPKHLALPHPSFLLQLVIVRARQWARTVAARLKPMSPTPRFDAAVRATERWGEIETPWGSSLCVRWVSTNCLRISTRKLMDTIKNSVGRDEETRRSITWVNWLLYSEKTKRSAGVGEGRGFRF